MATNGQTPLYQAAMKGHDAIVALLLGSGADQEFEDINGFTALMIAAERGCLKAVEVLLAKGADVKARSTVGWTALHLATQNRHEAVVRSLLIKKPDIHAKAGVNEQTPLYQAAMKGHEAIVALLLDSGADPKLGSRSIFARTPQKIADRSGHKGVVKLLSKRRG